MKNKGTKPIRIALIGSSTAAGHGAEPPEMSWANLYRSHLKSLHPGNDLINLGLGGLQTFQLLPTGHKPPPARPLPAPERNITKALSFQPDAVIVNTPSNDAAAFYGPEEQILNFDLIRQTAEAQGVPVWICTTQPRIFSAAQVEIQVRLKDAILSRYGDQAINVWDCLATPQNLPDPRFDLGDGTHLNNAGHALLFEQIKNRNLPEAIVEWQRKAKKRLSLASGAFLEIPQFAGGEVVVEVYDAQAQLCHRATGTLPLKIAQNIGPAGTYWVRVSGIGFSRMLGWVKTG